MPRATIEGHEVVAQDAVHLSDEAAPFYMRLEALPLSVWHYYAVITLSKSQAVSLFLFLHLLS